MDEIEIQLGGSVVTLRPTLGAAMGMSKRHGGLMNVLAGLERYDLAMAADVVSAGTGAGADQRQAIEEKVFAAGLAGLVSPLVRFVILLSNGGRSPEEPEEAKGVERPFA
ncbi:hypothetical protein [Ancylobacter vacuolatus]|uniref:Phage tail tube protein, GTA-gp10 n=1 Tax=Ancylobacter vacuolatus TaxID=223389 RepID=A0ABU0DHS2_9HYPH|nr:hypothetical protein [Ancylobacter vacuolatus]MDQ0347861.1 hypothetical protein [Ancylobacter vacuolatus]